MTKKSVSNCSSSTTTTNSTISTPCSSSSSLIEITTDLTSSNRLCSPSSLAALAILHKNSQPKFKKKSLLIPTSTIIITEKKSKIKENNSSTLKPKVNTNNNDMSMIPSEKQKETHALLQNYKEIYTMVKGHFIVPPNYAGHEHKWIQLDAGLCICEICGAEHMCFQGECPTIQMEQSESVCSISGCVIVLSEMKAEWGALERVHSPTTTTLTFGKGRSSSNGMSSSQPNVKHKKNMLLHQGHSTAKNKKRKAIMMSASNNMQQEEENEMNMKKKQIKCEKHKEKEKEIDHSAHLRPSLLDPIMYAQRHNTSTRITSLHSKRTSTIHDTVETVVREILDSPKTARCLEEEMARDNARRQSCLAKLIRELVANHHNCRERPNMLHLEAKLSWHCNKCRHITTNQEIPSSYLTSFSSTYTHHTTRKTISSRYHQKTTVIDSSIVKIPQQPQETISDRSSTSIIASSSSTTTLFMSICTQESNNTTTTTNITNANINKNCNSSICNNIPIIKTCNNISNQHSVCNGNSSINTHNKKTEGEDEENMMNIPTVKMTEEEEEEEEEEMDEEFHHQPNKYMVLQRVIRLCVDNICNLIQTYGWHRVDRQLQHASRGREFICSMLYLMRMGITFKNQTILQKMEILNNLLPLQVFLPTIFNIRAKSITEGENIIKLDLQHIPL